jgi:hypothetical protein
MSGDVSLGPDNNEADIDPAVDVKGFDEKVILLEKDRNQDLFESHTSVFAFIWDETAMF